MKEKRKRTHYEKTPAAAEPQKTFLGFRMTAFRWVLVIVSVIFIVFLAFIFMQPGPERTSSIFREPLIPVVGIKLLPGEKYVYSFGDDRLGKMKIVQEVGARGNGCILVSTNVQNMSVPFCLDEKTGEPRTTGQTAGGASIAVTSASPDFMQPWMLALTDGWSWRLGVNTTVMMMGSNETIEALSVYKVAARTNVKGRDSFKVTIETSMRRVSNGKAYESSNRTETVWIDADKRVLLYAVSNGVATELIEAPFKVEKYSG